MCSPSINIKPLLEKHFSYASLAGNANYMNQGQSVGTKSTACVQLNHLQVQNKEANPYDILASHMYEMYARKVPPGNTSHLQLEERQLGGVVFDQQFVNMLMKDNLECGGERYAGYTFIAENDNRALKHYTNNGAILVGSDLRPRNDQLEHLKTSSSLVFVANRWVFLAIIHNNTPNTCYAAENLKLYTWTRSFDDDDWENRDTLVARKLEDLVLFLEYERDEGFCSRLQTMLCTRRSPQVMPESIGSSPGNIRRIIVVNLGITNNFKLDRLLLAWVVVFTEALTPEERNYISVQTYFNNVLHVNTSLISRMITEERYNRSFLQTPPEEKFCLPEPESWQFSVSALVPVKSAVKIFDELILPDFNSTGSSSILLNSSFTDEGQQVYDFATILKEKIGSDAVKDKLSEWDDRAKRENELNVIEEAE